MHSTEKVLVNDIKVAASLRVRGLDEGQSFVRKKMLVPGAVLPAAACGAAGLPGSSSMATRVSWRLNSATMPGICAGKMCSSEFKAGVILRRAGRS